MLLMAKGSGFASICFPNDGPRPVGTRSAAVFLEVRGRGLCCFVLEARYTAGTNLVIDGGYSAR